MNLLEFLRRKPPKLGLALSGGATHGVAHIGILQVLEREGIRPDFVAGTSAGAMVGAAYCAGVPLKELEKIYLSIHWPNLVKISLKNPLALFSAKPFEDFCRKIIGDCEFKDLDLPFAVICCDIVTGERVILDKGAVAPAVRASSAIPGLLSPVEIDGHLLVDGNIVENVPVDQVRTMGAKFIVGCDVSKRGKSSKHPENPMDVILSMIYILQDRSSPLNMDICDCLIQPEIAQYSAWGFRDSAKILAEGRKAAEAALPQLTKFRSRTK